MRRELFSAVGAGVRSRPVPASPPVRAGEAGEAGAGERRLRLGLVGLGLVVLAAAVVLQPVAPGSPASLSAGAYRLPELCAFKAATGVPCPGCGLTRSWVSALHGDAAGSLRHHPLGWLVLLYALAQGARHGAWLAAPRRREGIERLGRRLDRGIMLLGALLFGAWIPTLIRTFANL